MSLSQEIEQEKAFILDTIECTGNSRRAIICSLALKRHIDPKVWDDLKKIKHKLSEPVLDYLACTPCEVQRDITELMLSGIEPDHAIFEVSGKLFSEDREYLTQLLDSWNKASPLARTTFMKLASPQTAG